MSYRGFWKRYLWVLIPFGLIISTICGPLVIVAAEGYYAQGSSVQLRESWNLDDYPLNVFMGIAAPYARREDMVKEALLQCARSIAINEMIEMVSSFVTESHSVLGLLSYGMQGQASYSGEHLKDILDRIELIDIKEISGEGMIALVSDPNKAAAVRPYRQSFDSQGKPDWVDHTPTIPGYYVAVGEVLGYRFLSDSMEAADVTAAESLLDMTVTAVTNTRSYQVTRESEIGGRGFSAYQQGLYQTTSGYLQGFVVIARWYDPTTNHFYSLAVVPR